MARRLKRDATIDMMYKRLFGKNLPKDYTKDTFNRTIPGVNKNGQLRPRRRKK